MKHSMLVSIMVLAVTASCGKKDGAGGGPAKALAKMTEFKDRLCACKDKACADAVSQELSKWMSDVASTGPKSEAPTKEQEEKMGDVAKQLGECSAKLSGK
jgi:hypothetical protein